MLPKAIYRFDAIPIRIPMSYFTELEQIFQKLIYGKTKALLSNSDPEKEEQSWKNLATYYQTILQVHNNQNRMVLA